MLLLLKMTSILCLKEKECKLVRMLSDKYQLDYVVLIVGQGQRVSELLAKQQQHQERYTQVVTADNIDILVNSSSKGVKVGYFLFVESDEESRAILSKFDTVMFRTYVWFIKTNNLQTIFNLQLGETSQR